jgi:hypothetical protein
MHSKSSSKFYKLIFVVTQKILRPYSPSSLINNREIFTPPKWTAGDIRGWWVRGAKTKIYRWKRTDFRRVSRKTTIPDVDPLCGPVTSRRYTIHVMASPIEATISGRRGFDVVVSSFFGSVGAKRKGTAEAISLAKLT